MKRKLSAAVRWLGDGFSGRMILMILLGAAICSFGIHNIHQRTGITEGGVIGMMLLVEHWLGFSPAYITPVLDIACYLLAWRYLGAGFIKVSVVSTLSVSLFYKVWEQFPPMLPDFSAHPLAAAVLGGLFVGVGVGLIVRQGGLQRRRRRPGPGHLQGEPLAAGPVLPVHRHHRAGAVPVLYPRQTHRLFPHHRHHLLVPHR